MSDKAVGPDQSHRISERVRNVPPSGIRRFFEIAATMEDVISLGIGEPDFVSPRPIIDAAIASLNEGKTSYTANAGLFDLRKEVADDLSARYGVEYNPRSEERRVGKECRSRWAPDPEKKKSKTRAAHSSDRVSWL